MKTTGVEKILNTIYNNFGDSCVQVTITTVKDSFILLPGIDKNDNGTPGFEVNHEGEYLLLTTEYNGTIWIDTNSIVSITL